MSLHYLHGSVHPFFNEIIKEIDSIDLNGPKQLARLIYLSNLFKIFHRINPLGYDLFHMFEEIIDFFFVIEKFLLNKLNDNFGKITLK
jgi:hypothetical protein